MGKLTATSTDEAFGLEIEHRGRFTAGHITGSPVGGITESERGLLPEPYWAGAATATYAVFSYGTPIAWEVPGGEWVIPNEKYSGTTNNHREKIRRALAAIGRTVTDGLS